MAKYEGDSLNAGYCEYLTPVKATGKVIMARILTVFIAVILSAFMLWVTLKTIPVASFLFLVLIIFTAWFAFQFTKIEYEYIIATGTLELSKIYGARVRKNLFEIKTSDIFCITPVEKLEILRVKKENVLYTCKQDAQNVICVVYSQNGSENKAIVISAPDKTVACLKYYRKSAFRDM